MAMIYMSPNPYGRTFEEPLDLRKFDLSKHPTAGLCFITKDGRLILASMDKSSPGARIDKWRSRIRGAWLVSIGDTAVSTLAEAQSAFRLLSNNNARSCLLTFTHSEFSPDISHNSLPIISRDNFLQLTHYQLNNHLDLLATSPQFPRLQKYSIVKSSDVRQYVTRVMRLTRGRLLKQEDWKDWQNSEYLQLNQYWDQGCLGMPSVVDQDDIVFHLVWTYNIKAVDGRKKARYVCNGSSQSGSVKVLDKVYANCVDQTSDCLFYTTLWLPRRILCLWF